MNLNKLYLTKNDCYNVGAPLAPKGLMVHSTGANNPNLRRYVGPDDGVLGPNPYNNHWNQPKPDGIQKCVHAFIGLDKNGKIRTYQTLPWNMRGWHAGGSANNTHIGFEICEDALQNAVYFSGVYKEAVEFCAYLCAQFDLNPHADGVLIDHSEGSKRGVASNHSDVGNWFPKFGKTMNDFRNDVYALLYGLEDNEVLSEMKVKVGDGEVKVIPSILKNGSNYPNLRALSDVLGYEVIYDAGTKVVTLSK